MVTGSEKDRIVSRQVTVIAAQPGYVLVSGVSEDGRGPYHGVSTERVVAFEVVCEEREQAGYVDGRGAYPPRRYNVRRVTPIGVGGSGADVGSMGVVDTVLLLVGGDGFLSGMEVAGSGKVFASEDELLASMNGEDEIS